MSSSKDKARERREKEMIHAFVPDLQIKPGIDLGYLSAIGNYLAAKKPDRIILIGDVADMPSLSSFDIGTKAFEGRSYRADVDSVHEGMNNLMRPIYREQNRLISGARKRWKPELILTLGNHENRINRAINLDRKLDGLISTDDLGYKDHGWSVYPFLEVVVRDGIAYSHYFTSGVMGRAVGTAAAQLNKKHMSCVAGHQQGRQISYARRADGKEMTSIIAGSCYDHDEDYLGVQGNQHWRGMYMFHNVDDGSFDEMAVPLEYIKENYGGAI